VSLSPAATTGDVIGFAELLDTLGYTGDELVSVVLFDAAGAVQTAVLAPGRRDRQRRPITGQR
jgi:hypothetical protein